MVSVIFQTVFLTIIGGKRDIRGANARRAMDEETVGKQEKKHMGPTSYENPTNIYSTVFYILLENI